MTSFLEELLSRYRTELERLRNRPLLRGAMAACALAAVADGPVTFSERIRVDQILETLEKLKVYDPHEGVELFNQFAEDILAFPREGRERALDAVQEATRDRDTAALLVRICLAVAQAKSEKKLVEQIEIVMLCSLLGVEPAEAGLYTDGAAPAAALGLEGKPRSSG